MMVRYIKYLVLFLTAIIIFFLLQNFLSSIKGAPNSIPNEIEIELQIEVKENDVFQVFYKNDKDLNFSEANSKKVNISGSNDIQKIHFIIPVDSTLNSIRMDMGDNVDQKKIVLHALKFEGGINSFSIDPTDIETFFNKNSFIDSVDNGVVVFKNLETSYHPHDPFFYLKDINVLFTELTKPISIVPYYSYIALLFSVVFYICVQRWLIRSNYVINEGLINYAFVFLFITLLLSPEIATFFSLEKDKENIEKRDLKKRPEFKFSESFSKEYEAYYNDNFGCRNVLIDWAGQLKTRLFKTSTRPNKVMFGNDGWLFFNSKEDAIYKSFTNVPFTEDQIKSAVNDLISRKKYCEDKKVKYMVGFYPNKHTIYNSEMPLSMKMQIKGDRSKADLMQEHIQKNKLKLRIFDVRSKLIEEKEAHQIYHKFDTHWNSYGAFIGYQEVMRQGGDLLNGVEVLKKEDFEISFKKNTEGDLLNMLGVHDKSSFIEESPVLKLKKPGLDYNFVDEQPNGILAKKVITINKGVGNRLRVLMFRDSFSSALIPYYSSTFYEIIYMWEGFNEELVNQYNPDLVIDVRVERFF